MAVNFGLLQPAAPVSAFFQGQQDVRQQADQNMLRQQQAEQMAFQRENMLAQRGEREAMAQERRAATMRATERQAYLKEAADALAQGNEKLDRPTLMRVLKAGTLAEQPALIQFAQKTLTALDEEDLYAREAERFGMRGAAAPAGEAPTAKRVPLPAAPPNMFAGTLADIGTTQPAPVNALAAPAAPAGVTRETVQNMLMSPSARIREQAKALAQTLEKPERPYEPTEVEKLTNALRNAPPGSPEAQALQSRIRILTTREPKEAKADETKVIAQTVYDAAGTPTFLNKFGQVITPTTAAGAPATVKGKPSATFEKTTAQRKQLSVDLDRAIGELTEAAKDGGLIDRSTGSGIGRGRDIAMGLYGGSSSGAIASSELAPIADMALKMVPRFEGPQSNKDTTSYEQAAGQLGNPTIPSDRRKAAAKVLVRLMTERKGQFITREMATEGSAAAPATGGRPSLDDIFKQR